MITQSTPPTTKLMTMEDYLVYDDGTGFNLSAMSILAFGQN
jgi:hypothetical protein